MYLYLSTVLYMYLYVSTVYVSIYVCTQQYLILYCYHIKINNQNRVAYYDGVSRYGRFNMLIDIITVFDFF